MSLIRPAAALDARPISALLGQLGYPNDPADIPGRLRHLREGGHTEALVALHEGAVVGLATVHIQPSLTRSEDVASLTTLIVSEEHRGLGIGRELVRAAEAFGEARGCGRIVVTTANHRDGAHAFYSRLGWEWTGRRYVRTLPSGNG